MRLCARARIARVRLYRVSPRVRVLPRAPLLRRVTGRPSAQACQPWGGDAVHEGRPAGALCPAPNVFEAAVVRRRPCCVLSPGWLTARDVVLQAPRCGFSRQMVALLNEAGVSFDSFDILSDNAVRQGLKKFSDWPTYPQLYVRGKLIGGLDIVREMKEEAENGLAAELGIEDAAAALNTRLKKLTTQSHAVLFMKGASP